MTYFGNKLKNVNTNINSNKTKHVLVENELNEISEKVKAKYQQKNRKEI